ncbi:MAG: hypothetical protein NVS4B12_28440 [Ktedonobacteraceae bacterium]
MRKVVLNMTMTFDGFFAGPAFRCFFDEKRHVSADRENDENGIE